MAHEDKKMLAKANRLVEGCNAKIKKTEKKAEEKCNKAKDKLKIAKFTQRVIELLGISDNVTILIAFRSDGWTLMSESCNEYDILSKSFNHADGDKVLEIVKEYFGEVGIKINNLNEYKDLIVFWACKCQD